MQPPTQATPVLRKLPIGAETLPGGGVHFRVWAPDHRRLEIVLEDAGAPHVAEMAREDGGYFASLQSRARPGTHYRFRLDGTEQLLPDPASRFQPEGPHGPSQVVDPGAYRWSDGGWKGITLRGSVLYELHIGTFTREGTWEAASRELRALADLGVTVIEVMPVADFPGRFGWGYDGVNLFAPTRNYGSPDDMRRFVDRAHAAGLGVVLDVVYNHFGPDGNYLAAFTRRYFTDRHVTDWGEAINFDGDDAGPVREFFTANAGYWIDEFHVDGLRLDATDNINDSSPVHVLASITRRVREAANGRSTLILAENEAQHTKLVRPPDKGGFGIDAVWNDDFHHAAAVALTGRDAAYYTDYAGTPQELISSVRHGYLYQGQWYSWQQQRRGTPARGLQPAQFVMFIENHDQVANSATGQRMHQLASPGVHRAITALTLLAPGTPMLFQGQEFSASTPFLYFADHTGELAAAVRRGRAEFLSQFPNLALPDVRQRLADPADPATFERCKLDFGEREENHHALRLHRDLLALRREDPAFRAQRAGAVDGAVLSERSFVLRFRGEREDERDDRLLVINLGPDLPLRIAPEPLLAPPANLHWTIIWSSENPAYGGLGSTEPETATGWRLTGRCAVVLAPVPESRATPGHQPSDASEPGP